MCILQLVFRKLILCILFPLSLFAQEVGERFWSGLITYNAYVNNTVRFPSSGNYSSDHATSYSVDGRITIGKFISNNRAFSYGMIGRVNYYESDFFKVNGKNAYTISYQLGAQFVLNKYYSIFPKFYATMNNDFNYTYNWNEGNDLFSNSINTHGLFYRFSPGLYYRLKPRWGLQLNLSLLSISINRSVSSNSQSQTETQRIYVDLFSGTSLGNLTFGVLYFPFQSQHKKHK